MISLVCVIVSFACVISMFVMTMKSYHDYKHLAKKYLDLLSQQPQVRKFRNE